MVDFHHYQGQLAGTEWGTVDFSILFHCYAFPSKTSCSVCSCLSLTLSLSNSLFSSFLRLSLSSPVIWVSVMFPFVAQELPLWEILLSDRGNYMDIFTQILVNSFIIIIKKKILGDTDETLSIHLHMRLPTENLTDRNWNISATVNQQWVGLSGSIFLVMMEIEVKML